MGIALSPGYTKALFRRGLLYMELEQYSNAQADFEQVARRSPNFAGLADALPRARRWASRPPQRNHYAILGGGFDAEPAEIKRAYKTAALRWHPDKNRQQADRAERIFKNVLEAFDVLSDPLRRREY